MAFDSSARSKLQRLVAACRKLLTDEFDDQLQGIYGIYARDGQVLDLDKLTSLDDDQQIVGALLRERIDHLRSGLAGSKSPLADAVQRVLREQAFTVLNRFAALRLAEERALVLPCVVDGLKSEGFQVFENAASPDLGSQYERYVVFLGCLFDELSLDLGVLFDRYSPFGLLFPREPKLKEFLELLNAAELKPFWREDETIGWIYQYFNGDDVKKMRDDAKGGPPRNSRELAVRNQFFTPRYVVEFLTDNTLGRLWYEMTCGVTALREECRYLVRRPREVFLRPVDEYLFAGCRDWVKEVRGGNFAAAPEDATWDEISSVALAIDGQAVAGQLGLGDVHDYSGPRWERVRTEGIIDAASLLDQWLLLFSVQRGILREGNQERFPEYQGPVRAVWHAWVLAAKREPGQQSEPVSQEELLRQPVLIPPRPLKDPREIRLLDPACGSMHFGLYAFDLFALIYEEAWEIAHGPSSAMQSAADFASFVTYAATFPDKPAFLREVPRLIIERNIHGIDIDPRAAQIAGLSLWLRAQRIWQQAGVKPAERPRITRSNIVCAEPMPGERELLREFVEQQFPAGERPAFQFLLEKIFDRMALAGEAGSLLRIEEEIRTAIVEARTLAQTQSSPKQTGLFPADEPLDQVEFDLRGLDDEQFWRAAEQRIYEALEIYAGQVEDSGGSQRRLFADDAAQGFAFIDLCRKRYDVVVMNPPFGDSTIAALEYLKTTYLWRSRNILCAFVSRAHELATSGAIGAITDATWLKKSDYNDFRAFMLARENGFRALVDLGWGVLDNANVASCCFSGISNSRISQLTSIRLVEVSLESKSDHLLDGLDLSREIRYGLRYEREVEFFERFPGKAIAYEVPDALVPAFKEWKPLQPTYAITRRGYTPGDTFRFFRCWWEVLCSDSTRPWWTLNNGGPFAPIIGDGFLLALHETDWASYRPLSGFRLESETWFGKPGIGWGKRTDFMYAYPLPSGSMFSHEGPCAFPVLARHLYSLLAYVNSSVGQTLLNLFCGQHKLAGYVAELPTPDLDCEELQTAGELTRVVLEKFAAISRRDETSEIFAGVVQLGTPAVETSNEVVELAGWYETKLSEIDELVLRALPRTSKAEQLTVPLDKRPKTAFSKKVYSTNWASEVLSFALGCVVGRWDIRYSTLALPTTNLPDPSAPLPVCPPGMLQESGQPLPAEAGRRLRSEGGYPIDVAWDGILVDDSEHSRDLESHSHAALTVLWGERTDALEQEACALLGTPSLREWFRRPGDFFADHLKRYTKSRRQAPIYWPLSTASGKYTLWLYYHRLNDQTLFTCVTDFLKPKFEAVTADVNRLENKSQTGSTATERAELQDLRDFRSELQEMHDELLRVAQLPWKPNLNDGVLITASPLWKLFRLPKWQKDLKTCWEELTAGDYDWAHLAFTIRPDAVREKCKTDRSLAIAHGLESLYEVAAPPPKTRRRRGESPDSTLL